MYGEIIFLTSSFPCFFFQAMNADQLESGLTALSIKQEPVSPASNRFNTTNGSSTGGMNLVNPLDLLQNTPKETKKAQVSPKFRTRPVCRFDIFFLFLHFFRTEYLPTVCLLSIRLNLCK